MATDAEKIKMYREKAKDTSIPQEVRNTYLDRANELERRAYEVSKGEVPVVPEKKMAKGGMVSKAKTPMKKAPVKAMAKGGAVKGGMAMFEKSGKDIEKKGMKEGSKADMALDKKQMMGMKNGGMAKPSKAPMKKAMAKGGMAKKGK